MNVLRFILDCSHMVDLEFCASDQGILPLAHPHSLVGWLGCKPLLLADTPARSVPSVIRSASTSCVLSLSLSEAVSVRARGCACTALERRVPYNASVLQPWHNIDLRCITLHGCVLTGTAFTDVR